MHLTLLVPGLLLPVEILETTVYDLNAPTLSRLLGCGTRLEMPNAALADLFGLAPLPAAALRKVSSDETAPGDWICLDPVRWHVAAQGVTLDDPAKLGLDAVENAELLAIVQPLLADWGELSSSSPGCWELRLKNSLAIDTLPLHDAIHQPIDPSLPGGADGAAWRLLLAEVQTVLHAHPVNRRREEAGRPTVNSLWPWGQGTLPNDLRASFSAVWSNDPVVTGLCCLAGMAWQAPPERFQTADEHVLADLDRLAAPARSFDALAWCEALLDLEHDWISPAITAMKRGECTGLRLIGTRFGASPTTVSWDLQRTDLLRIWRKPLPLAGLK